jgi:hypothetical protein
VRSSNKMNELEELRKMPSITECVQSMVQE